VPALLILASCFYASANNTRRPGGGVICLVCRPPNRPLTPIWRDETVYCIHFNETYHKYSSCEWELLKRFSRSEVKGQGHITRPNSKMAEDCTSTVWRRSSSCSFAALCYRKMLSMCLLAAEDGLRKS